MSVRYKKVMGKGVGSPVANKWYGRAVSMGRVKTADLAEEISHSTTVTRADIMAVLIELTQVMKKHLQNSMTVELDGLGDFVWALRPRSLTRPRTSLPLTSTATRYSTTRR